MGQFLTKVKKQSGNSKHRKKHFQKFCCFAFTTRNTNRKNDSYGEPFFL